MPTRRLFVVVRDTEDFGRQMAVFPDLGDATAYYEEAAYVVRNAPAEGASDDLTIVTATALFVADTPDPKIAKAMATKGRVFLMESEEWHN